VLELPADRPRPAVQSFRGAVHPVALPASLVDALRDLGRRQGATLFMTLLAGFDVLLCRYTGQEDLLVGSPVANRPRAELESLVGLFVNTLILRGRLHGSQAGGPSFRELLDRVRSNALAAYDHQALPFERLVEELRVERSLARTPLHQVVFALQDGLLVPIALPGLTLEPLLVDNGTAKTDVLLSLRGTAEGLAGNFEYSTDLFDSATIERLSGHLRRLLAAAAADPERGIRELPLLDEAETVQILRQWNDTRRTVPDLCLHDLFAASVAARPEAVAATFAGESLTYAELDRRAGLLARRLRSLGVGPEVLVALCEPEGLGRLVAVLGIFKAGGAYLPLDPMHPAERLALLLEDSGARVLLTRSALLPNLPETPAQILCLDDPLPLLPDLPAEQRSPDNLAYVIYTSGSTGRPNGVLVPHRAAVGLILQAVEHFQVGPSSRVLQSVSFSFDASVLETWMAFAAGATLCVGSRESRLSGEAMAELIRREEITTAVLTPVVLAGLPVDGVPSLRAASVGGDRCPAELAGRWAPPASGLERLLNCYGPTESTIYATWSLLRAGIVGSTRREPPIGRPVANTRACVLDGLGQPVPIGVPGELHLAGRGLTRGYLGRPALTADRFRPDPFAPDPGGRLYRTGDLARWLPDGTLEFLGRADGQVKLRGVRIEVGEVEAALAGHPAVAECAVVLREGNSGDRGNPGERFMAAFVVLGDGGAGADLVRELRDHLRTRLPETMVPSRFLILESLPLSPTGKVDRGALERLDLSLDEASGRVEPRDVIELELARIWADVLEIPRVGVRDNFFDLGGHSLLAVRLMARVQQRFGREIPLAALFHDGTVEQMAALLRREAEVDTADGPPSCLVPIRPDGGAPPFYCVHPAGGDVLGYAALARHLGPGQPVFGLQARGLSGAGEPLETIPDMAALYADEIRRVQPEGPYRLGGWSLGGLVAFEMARRLRDQGEDVALLAILDSSPCIAGLGGEVADDVDLLQSIVAYVANLWHKDIALTREDLEGLDSEEQLSRTLDVLRAADFLPPGAGLGQLRRALAVYRASSRAVRTYQPRPYAGGAVLFRTANAGELPDDLGWGGLLGEPLEIEDVPGQHHNLLAEPHVEALAGRLQAHLEKVAAREPSPARLG
jgi:amino acid adenylation domain-containing protein